MEVLILEGDESDEVKFEIKELQYRIDELKRVAKKVIYLLPLINMLFVVI